MEGHINFVFVQLHGGRASPKCWEGERVYNVGEGDFLNPLTKGLDPSAAGFIFFNPPKIRLGGFSGRGCYSLIQVAPKEVLPIFVNCLPPSW